MTAIHVQRIERLCRATIYVALAYIMLRPVSHNMILVPAIGLMTLASAWLAYIRGRISSGLLLTAGLMLAVGVYGTLVGIGNPGLIYGVFVWIIAPSIFTTFAAAGDERLIRRILQISLWTTIVISIFIMLYVAGEAGWLPRVFPKSLILQMGGGNFAYSTGGSTAITLYPLTTLVAAVPIWITATLLPRHHLLPRRLLTLLAAAAGLIATLMSGRGALIVVTAVVPAVMWIMWRIATRAEPRSRLRKFAPIGFVALAGAAVALLASVSDVVAKTWARLSGTLTGNYASVDDQIRGFEAHRLMEAWKQSPLIGQGWGAVIPGYSRNEARPWNFELQYHLILFQVGLVGAAILAAAAGVAVLTVIAARRLVPEMTVVLLVTSSGALSIIVSNAINPYLQAPGNMWSVYLVLMVANAALLSGATNPGSHTSRSWLRRAEAVLAAPRELPRLGSLRPAATRTDRGHD